MRVPAYLVWPLLFLGQLIATGLLAWHLLAAIDFAYPTGYRLLDLQKHIAEYAPRNRYKHGFEFTGPQEHWDLFAQIAHAVQHNGKGLPEISYRLPNGTREPLMHAAEITHLQDVSKLIDRFYLVGSMAAILWISCFILAYRQGFRFPSTRNIMLGFCGGIFLVTSLLLSIGATRVFYWFHTKIFPDGHQWFFYYEDSLMTTLMKAPDIFAFIASLLLAVWVIAWGASTWGMISLLRRRTKTKKSH